MFLSQQLASNVLPYDASKAYRDDNAYKDVSTETRLGSPSQALPSPLPLTSKAELVGKQPQTKDRQVPGSTLSVNISLENEHGLSFNNVHKMWGMISLKAVPYSSLVPERSAAPRPPQTPIDFVVVIDSSSSMNVNKKIAFVKATIEYLVSHLNEAHRFCLIKFNQEASIVTSGLLPMTPENKQTVLTELHCIKAAGSTNLSDAVFTSLGVLKSRQDKEQTRLSSIMLFSDGLANAGVRGKRLFEVIGDVGLPHGLAIHTFGFGSDHDSRLLHQLSSSTKGGVYYYLENVEAIPSTFGECLAGLLGTVAHNIEVRLVGLDGSRIVNFYTRFPVTETTAVKDYSVSLGTMYSEETRTVLFKLSLRKMSETMAKHTLLQAIISYTNTLSGIDQREEILISIPRPANTPAFHIPILLDLHINRYTAAAAIEEAVQRAHSRDFAGAQQRLQEVMESIEKSRSARELSHSAPARYCADLLADLKECCEGLSDTETYQSVGLHYALCYSTMYFLERSTGMRNMLGVKRALQLRQQQQQAPEGQLAAADALTDVEAHAHHQRHNGYGYTTFYQEEERTRAVREAAQYITSYLDDALV